MERGFYARVSRLGAQWLELDLHFLSLGGGEIALGWWFEECLVPYLVNTPKLEAVQSISIVTGYGKTRSRGARLNDDGMRLRVRAMLTYMSIKETPQPNKGRIHINKQELVEEVKKNEGKIMFDIAGYTRFKEEETTANKFPDVTQQVRSRFRPAKPGEGPRGTFIQDGMDAPVNPQPYQADDTGRRDSRRAPVIRSGGGLEDDRRDSRRSSYNDEDRRPSRRSSEDGPQDRRGSNFEDRNHHRDQDRRGSYVDQERRGGYGDQERRGSHADQERRGSYRERERGGGDGLDNNAERRGSYDDRDRRNDADRRSSRNNDIRPPGRDDSRGDRGDVHRRDDKPREPRRQDDRDQGSSRANSERPGRDFYHGDDRRFDEDAGGRRGSYNDGPSRPPREMVQNDRDRRGPDRYRTRDNRDAGHSGGPPPSDARRAPNHSDRGYDYRHSSDAAMPGRRESGDDRKPQDYNRDETSSHGLASVKEEMDNGDNGGGLAGTKRGLEGNRGYNIEPAFSKRRSM